MSLRFRDLPRVAEPLIAAAFASSQPRTLDPAHDLHPSGDSTPPSPIEPLRHGPLAATQSILYIIVIAMFVITFIAQPFRIPSESMEPTLLVGDFLLVNKQVTALPSSFSPLPAGTIRRGQIIVFRYPVDPSLHLVKRVIGLPGDRIHLRRGRVFVNDVSLVEPYAVYRSHQPDPYRDNFPRLQTADPDVDARWWIRMRSLVFSGELIVPPDSYFVLGDNRDNSEDSRYWGLVPRSSIVGQPVVVYFSLRERSGTADEDQEVTATTQPTAHPRSLSNIARWNRTLHLIR